MSKRVAILGTTGSHGGQTISASGSSWITPQGPVCLEGDSYDCPIHGINTITSGCTTKSNLHGVPIAIEGTVTTCGSVLNGNFASKVTLT